MRLLHLTKFENKRLIIKYLVIAMPNVRIADSVANDDFKICIIYQKQIMGLRAISNNISGISWV
jgi:hypothetical protein